jgi:hypothetical protein
MCSPCLQLHTCSQPHAPLPAPRPVPNFTPIWQDDFTLASRGTDCTLRLWDLRRFNSPLKTFDGLPANYSTTNVAFSPDERLVLTGTAAEGPRGGGGGGGGGGGTVVFVDRKELRVVRAVGMPAHVAAVRWHERINQILVGVGESPARGERITKQLALGKAE